MARAWERGYLIQGDTIKHTKSLANRLACETTIHVTLYDGHEGRAIAE